jgi:hypothetical protein
MLLVGAGVVQTLLICDLLLRRILFLFFSNKRSGLKRFADNAALSSFAAALLNLTALPVLVLTSIVNTLGRSLSLIALCFVVFASLLLLSTSAVYAFVVFSRIYNVGIAPVLMATRWIFVLLDFVFRAFMPLYNGLIFMASQIIRNLLLPYSFQNVDSLPEILQALSLALVTLALSVTSWLKNVMECTLLYQTAGRICGHAANMTAVKIDCSGLFSAVNTQCFAAPNHLTLDLLTPGLFVRQAMLSLRRVLGSHCGVAALMFNLLLFPLVDHRLYATVHAGVNTVLFGVIGLPVTTMRRCEMLQLKRAPNVLGVQGGRAGLSRTHEVVACTPDWEPLVRMASSTLDGIGEVIDGWLNAAALLVRDRLGGESEEGDSRCNEGVRMNSVVLDAARAIEGHSSIQALERLQNKGGLPDAETLMRVRVVGMTPKLFGVTDGKAVLYRSAHDGYVWAFGAWPFSVDVRLGLAPVSYSGSAKETDTTGDTRTGLLGCRCVMEGGFRIICATAPYVTHIDDDANVSAVHEVFFPELSLLGMSCANTVVRVLPLRWPRRRLATAEGNGGSGYSAYTRFSYLNIAQNLKGDVDTTDNMRLLASKYTATKAGAVEAAIFVQPLCSGGSNPACWHDALNCYPWCMGVVRGGVRAQNVTMYSTQRWEDHVVLPDVDCGVERHTEQMLSENCGKEPAASAVVDFMSQKGIVYPGCRAARMCTPSPIPASVMSLVPLLNRDTSFNETELALMLEHKTRTWYSVRTQEQPFVVAGDVMLGIQLDNLRNPEHVVVTRLYDIGHGSLQMSSERLVLTSNSHAIKLATCNQADTSCYANSMADGKIVLPRSIYKVYREAIAAGGEPPGLLPATASRWAVHWAENPDLDVYRVVFKFCNGEAAAFGFIIHSSFGRARVWTAQTMRGVDMEAAGSPSSAEVRSRVSYMRVPEFYGDFFKDKSTAADQCDVVVGMKIVSVEYLNTQNVLVTVLAARPRDYNPDTDTVTGPRIYRYYFLHPSRHDCRDVDDAEAVDGEKTIFSCWRTHDQGMWSGDELLAGRSWGASSTNAEQLGDTPCIEARTVPAFGSALTVPLSAILSLVHVILDTVCTLTAAVAAVPKNPLQALRDLHTVDLEQVTFHSMTDSAGERLLHVDDIIAAGEWCARFNAHLMIYAVNTFSSVSSTLAANKLADRTLSGLRTIVVGAAKVAEGAPGALPAFAGVEAMFQQPIAFSSMYASTAVLGMADGLVANMRLPVLVRTFVRTQAGMVGSFSMLLKVGRVVLLRVLQVGDRNPAAVVSSALLESRSIVKTDLLDTMRFQCYGLAQMVGAEKPWGKALEQLCLLFPDTIEGVMTVAIVLLVDYPTVSCACKLSEGDMINDLDSTVLDSVTLICALRPLPLEEKHWLAAFAQNKDDQQSICFIAMDLSNSRLSSAFDKTYNRFSRMTEHAEGVVDGLLGVITGDSVDCDAFDVSPYVVSIIPDPVDYFSSCVDTEDCGVKCMEEFSEFNRAKALEESKGIDLGMQTDITVDMESMLFSARDIEDGKNKPPFMILDMTQIPQKSCAQVCGGTYYAGNQCLILAGLSADDSVHNSQKNLAIAYYCLPIDITQYAFQWRGMEAKTLNLQNSATGYPSLPAAHTVMSVHIASSWGPQDGTRDMLIVETHSPDNSFTTQTDFVQQSVTTVMLFKAGKPTPFQIMRTALHSERSYGVLQQLQKQNPENGFLHKIEHLQVDIADNIGNEITLEARGWTIHQNSDTATESGTFGLPEKACVLCKISFRDSDFLPQVFCEVGCHQDPPYTDVDFVLQHKRICVRELGADDDESLDNPGICEEHLALPSVSKAERALYFKTNSVPDRKKMSIPESLVSLFRIDSIARAYKDIENNVHARTILLSRVLYLESRILRDLRLLVSGEVENTEGLSGATVMIEIPTANARDVRGGWLHILNLQVSESVVSGMMHQGLRTSTTAHILKECSVHNCGACARREGGSIDEDLFSLEILCYAAQQCGIERCAGTLVNMRKPLCNLGKVLTSEMHGMRVLLKGVWNLITDKIIMTVELTHQRREEYTVRWPDVALRQHTCTTKDTIVSMAATITSVLGARSHVMHDVSVQNPHKGTLVDARMHARQIMILTATTNFITSVLLLNVYHTIVAQKFISCTSSGFSSSLTQIIDTASTRGQPELTINFGGVMQQAAERSNIAVCLSEEVRQSLEDAGADIEDMKERKSGTQKGRANKITRLISDSISSLVDEALSTWVALSTNVADVYIAWAFGMIKGMMDVAQTIDWERCKLPDIDNSLEMLGKCACGDEAYSIPAKSKLMDISNQAFWCSGLLMLNNGDGSDLLVWNPFSYSSLLNMRTGDGEVSYGYNDYVECLQKQWPSECEIKKPKHPDFVNQGVDLMQVIGRCRDNYQQKRWDEASTLYALFTVEEWRTTANLKKSVSARLDDKFTLLRKKVVRLLEMFGKSNPVMDISPLSWVCLADSLAVGNLKHNCHREVDSNFVYERAVDGLSSSVDACRVPEKISDRSFPRMLWTGDSSNHAPLTKVHSIDIPASEREKIAESKIERMIENEITPVVSKMLQSSFGAKLKAHLDVEAFSVEGDELHQLIDCIILGPYAAAAMSANVHLENMKPLPVPLYHRGSAFSREFTAWGGTGGSPIRKAFMHLTRKKVEDQAVDIVTKTVITHMQGIAAVWTNKENFLCTCKNTPPSIQCCAGVRREYLRFGLQNSMGSTEWDISHKILSSTFDLIANSNLIDRKWLQQIGDPVTLNEDDRSIVSAAQLFRSSGNVPIHTYGTQDSIVLMNNESLWEWCTSRVTGLFGTMPLTGEDLNKKEGRASKSSIPHVPMDEFGGPYQYDPSQDHDNAPTRDHQDARNHAMELVVDQLLSHSRSFAPHFWTHAHRYVASDSVWCEGEYHGDTEVRQTATPSSLSTASQGEPENLRQEALLAPDIDQLLYPTDVLQACACGWKNTEHVCYIPAEVCAHGRDVLTDARLADGRLKRDAWAKLCENDTLATYTLTGDDLLAVLQVLQDLDSVKLVNCSAKQLSIAWGLLDPQQAEEWYAGNQGRNTNGWRMSAQHLATEGPGGLRIGMLSPHAPQTMQEHVSDFELGEGAEGLFNARYKHTIAQPVCNSSLQKLLREELDEYFVNTLLPMAHSVQIVPAVEYCVRWTIEYALLSMLRLLLEETQDNDQVNRDRFLLLLSRQQTTANVWRDRCSTQAQDVALCVLRGVYDIIPEDKQKPPTSCAFAGHTLTDCTQYYYTSSCILYCDGIFYDPCMCEQQGEDSACSAVDFHPKTCEAGKIVDGRRLFADHAGTENLLTNSLHWPSTILAGEARDYEHEQQLLDALQGALAVAKHDVDLSAVFHSATGLLLQREDEEKVPKSYCDDLLDYWPDVQHPVGYHPTSACSASETHTRGFSSWMSETPNGHDTLIEPVRMRNMTVASQVFGAAHLVCDAQAYATPAHRLNPYYMQSKWSQQASADPSIPRSAPVVDLEDMNFVGSPSLQETDTTLRKRGHESDLLLQHSVGLVRSWARWYTPTTDATASNAEQMLLNTVWPHWVVENSQLSDKSFEVSGHFLADGSQDNAEGCGFPALDVCTSHDECNVLKNINAKQLVCLQNFDVKGVAQTGVCMEIGTCYQHQHCDGEKLCSGQGKCVSPSIRVKNKARKNAEVQLFAERGCDVSMQKVSLFESIPDFAYANGMCSFRNWYHYHNTTEKTDGFQYVKEVPDTLFLRTTESEAKMLSDMQVLSHKPHSCDRSYSYTKYKACYEPANFVGRSDRVSPVNVSRTWVFKDDKWHARFCDMKGGDVTGFLDPYKRFSTTLHSASQEIRKCVDFNLCPSILFHVKGKSVEKRRVMVYTKNNALENGVEPSKTTRDYCALDAQRCWGTGYMLGTDCEEVNQEVSNLCIPDILVLPLVTIVFGEQSTMSRDPDQAEKKLNDLRQFCVNAFDDQMADLGKSGLLLFMDVLNHLTTPYKWTENESLLKVKRYANALLWFVFGMNVEGQNRGFSNDEEYIAHSNCLVYLAKKLVSNEKFIDEETTQEAVYPTSFEKSLVPGSSLYIFERRVPVPISFRWFAQCVVLATGDGDGGVPTRFLAQLLEGIHTDRVQCENYKASLPAEELPLKKWLQTAKFLFQRLESRDSDSPTKASEFHTIQIGEDVIQTITWAVSQLPVMDIPDLVCIGAEHGFTDLIHINSDYVRYRNPRVVLSKPGGFLTMFADSGNSSIYNRVLEYLTSEMFYWDPTSPSITMKTLIEENVVENLHTDLNKNVFPSDVYPMYDYVKLRPAPMQELYNQIQKNVERSEYLQDGSTCECGSGESGDKCQRLTKPEYALSRPMKCSYNPSLPCTDNVKVLVDQRFPTDVPTNGKYECEKNDSPCQFLQEKELLYLVLLILDRRITDTVSGGFMALHKIRDPEAANAVDALYNDPLAEDLQYLDFTEAKHFNTFVEARTVMNFKCPSTTFDFQLLTNQMHKTMQSCATQMQDNVGWNVPVDHTLTFTPKVDSLLHGFYPTFLLGRDRKKTFLHDLLFTDWHLAIHGHSFMHSICYVDDDNVKVMAPFWAEFFDVANNLAQEDSATDPPLACDMKRSSKGSSVMFYNTLCAASLASVETCANHPVYENYIKNVLPSVCTRNHGHTVVRSHIGALIDEPLCEKMPEFPENCPLEHGTLLGHKGDPVTDLEDRSSSETVDMQSGLWNIQNSIFRGRLTRMALERVPALKLLPQDIGGHCLEFAITEDYLYLNSVHLGDCDHTGGNVVDWLQNIEQNWAWEHDLAQKILDAQDVSESSTLSWRCPLHWLGQFHDNNDKQQAQSPSWHRNKARFAHITGAFHYAHPTIKGASKKLRGLRAASFLSDTVACVAADSAHCHSSQYLSSTMKKILGKEEWHVVDYVTNEPSLTCDRVLDWPNDCGSRSQTGKEGVCVVRN